MFNTMPDVGRECSQKLMCIHFKDCLNVYLFMCTYLDMTLRNYGFLSMVKNKEPFEVYEKSSEINTLLLSKF